MGSGRRRGAYLSKKTLARMAESESCRVCGAAAVPQEEKAKRGQLRLMLVEHLPTCATVTGLPEIDPSAYKQVKGVGGKWKPKGKRKR